MKSRSSAPLERDSSIDSTTNSNETAATGRRKWTSALKVVHAVTRLKNLPIASAKNHRPYESTNSDSSNGPPFSNESTPSRSEAPEVVDPVYLALKQATGKYGGQRRGSSNQFDSSTPSPRNLSQISLQDSGYAENVGGSRGQLLGSTPQLAPGPTQRPRAPKLNKQMKSLSLDCADAPPPVNTTMRSQFRNKAHLSNEWEQTSSAQQSPRNSDKQASHIVTHDYSMPDGCLLFIGDRMLIVDNGDPDWLHGFRINDRHQQLLTFPSTCVAAFQPDECPMKLIQNVHIPEAKLRFYRDQVVFGVPDPHNDLTRICVRNVRGAKAFCSIKYLRPL
ncbi:hypothetical protein M3Y96_00461500 [Aphelenchoides besseyi]|nr:hypothetical protein M3Y96_00461500 [Aphelenchoides besseyi]